MYPDAGWLRQITKSQSLTVASWLRRVVKLNDLYPGIPWLYTLKALHNAHQLPNAFTTIGANYRILLNHYLFPIIFFTRGTLPAFPRYHNYPQHQNFVK